MLFVVDALVTNNDSMLSKVLEVAVGAFYDNDLQDTAWYSVKIPDADIIPWDAKSLEQGYDRYKQIREQGLEIMTCEEIEISVSAFFRKHNPGYDVLAFAGYKLNVLMPILRTNAIIRGRIFPHFFEPCIKFWRGENYMPNPRECCERAGIDVEPTDCPSLNTVNCIGALLRYA